MPPAVELVAVSKSFGSTRVVDSVSFAIAPGEFFSLLGSSGCGKSTTLRLIAGFERPDAGSILFGGQPLDPKEPAYAQRVNMVFQNYALFPHMTVAENIGFGLKMSGLNRVDRELRIREMLEAVQLQGMESRMPGQLSGGQQQRVALARAMATRPEIVLLDEPLGALDLKLRRAMQQELKQLQQRHRLTFVYVTHDQEEALSMSDRLCVMHGGRAVQTGTPREIYDRPASRFVAEFIGENNLITASDGKLFALRPEHIRFTAPDEPASVSGVVGESVFQGVDTLISVRLMDGSVIKVRCSSRADLLPPGSEAGLTWPPDAAVFLPG